MSRPTGGSVDYYTVYVEIPQHRAPYTVECGDIIEALGMTFAEGCAFKAIWRSCAARTLGLVKPGADSQGVYDAEKIIFYAYRILAQRKRDEENSINSCSDNPPGPVCLGPK